MYSLDQVRSALRDPGLLLREANRLYYRRLYTRSYNERGVDIFAEDWDNMVILDACRYDLFEQVHDLPGTLEERVSRGSNTEEFLLGNVSRRELHDVVYVTANPQLYRYDETAPSLHDVVNVWREAGWNEEYRTVLPETVTEYARRAAREYPNKRLVVHYIQPHNPFIGPTGREHFDLDTLAFWQKVDRGEISVSDETLWRAYRENLELALPHVQDLLEELVGRTVVTADHGQIFGERAGVVPLRYYGHPRSVYATPLVRVPWLVNQRGERKEIVAEPSQSRDDVEAEVVSDRLQQLGYVE